jgi:hypothetical protein
MNKGEKRKRGIKKERFRTKTCREDTVYELNTERRCETRQRDVTRCLSFNPSEARVSQILYPKAVIYELSEPYFMHDLSYTDVPRLSHISDTK